MRRIFTFATAFAAAAVLAVSAFGVSAKLRATPSAFNPGGAGVTIVAAWQPGIGLPDAGGSDHGLILSISALVPFPPGASADATVDRVAGLTLTSLSFDHKIGTYCAGGAPRWDVEMTDGSVYGITCGDGTKSAVAGFPAWEHVTWSCANPTAAAPLSGPSGCAFGKTLTFAQVLVDEAGSTTLDNLELNGHVMGKPGNSPS